MQGKTTESGLHSRTPTKQEMFFFYSVHCATTRCNFTRELLLETDACRYPTSLYLPIYVFPVYKHCITSSTDDETSESLAKEL